MSYQAQVIADSTGERIGNGLRFATEEEAQEQVLDLSGRWSMVRDTRVIESTDPVNYAYTDGELIHIEPAFKACPEPSQG